MATIVFEAGKKSRLLSSFMANSHLVRAAIRVRGLGKVKCVMLIFALAHNLMRMAALAPDFIGIATGTSGIPGLPL